MVSILQKYSIDIAAIQEIRWKGTGVMDTGNFTMYYNGNIGNTFGLGFLVRKKYKHTVIGFEPINERLCVLRVRGKFKNTTMICAHAPTEEKYDESKETFCEKLDQIYHRAPAHDTKIIIGDPNAKIGQEEIFRPPIGKWSLHDISNHNRLKATDFASSNSMSIRSTYFPHTNIHKETWRPPDGVTKNQTDHAMIDGRHASSITDVRSCRGADCDTDHFLACSKYRQRISNYRKISGARKEKYDIGKLKDKKTLKKYHEEISKLLETDKKKQMSQSEDR
jgi:hypothetical protein